MCDIKSHMRVHADANAAARLSSSELWLPLAVFFACVLASLHASIAVPFPVPADAPATVFSEDRARGFLTGLLALGPFRTVGSRANEVLAPKFIEDAVADIKAASPGARIETQRHVGSGNFSLDFLGGFHNVYHDVQNVLVLVRGQQPPEAGVLMISAHYDTAVAVRGASDNGANVAILVECVRVLAASPALPYSVLFVFNGAEETILQGSHSLLVNRPAWLRHVKAFINLEAAGASGREMMFQAGRGMVEVYARGAPHPHASVLAQDVFQSGVIPSDTDFRVYVGLADPHANPNPYPAPYPHPYPDPLPGLDMANIHNGQVYHTKLDDAAHVLPGSMQRYGENVLGMIRAVDALPPPHPNAPVFFDVLGLFVVRLSATWCALLALLGVAVTARLWVVAWPDLDVHSAVFNRLHMHASALGKPLLTALLMCAFAPLAYYRWLWLAVPLYVFPAAVGMVQAHNRHPVPSLVKDKPAGNAELSAFCVSTGYFFALFLLLAAAGKGSAYLPWCMSVLPPLARLAAAASTAGGDLASKRAVLAAYTAGVALPYLLMLPPLLVVGAIFLPITGRSGLLVPGDVIVCVICVVCTYVALLVPCSLLHLVPPAVVTRAVGALRTVWLGAIALALLASAASTGGYSASHPKRVYAVQVERVGWKQAPETFLWIIGADASGLGRVVAGVTPAVRWIDCRKEPRVYCGLPWYLPMMHEIPVSAAAALAPMAHDDAMCAMRVTAEDRLSATARRVHLRITGASDHFTLIVPDEPHGGPFAWSFSAQPMPASSGHVYTSFASGVKVPASVELWVDVAGPLRALLACHYLEESLSTDASHVLGQLPQGGWLDVISFVSRVREYEM